MALETRMDVPELRFLRHYYDYPRYITALAESVDTHLSTLGWTPDVIMTSYHGLPQSYVDKGDPYQAECLETTALLRAHMGKSEGELYATFQSRFGPKAWLQPYTDKTLEHGGTHFTAIPCLNADAAHLDLLTDLAKERLLNGWL
jgi:ferrochelatase